jgi:hypothetical protein
VQLFYTLFTSIGHMLYGLNNLSADLRAPITPKSVGKLRTRLDEISNRYDVISNSLDEPDTPSDYRNFINRARRGTTDTIARVERAEFVCEKLKVALT